MSLTTQSESVPLEEAHGRVLARDVVAVAEIEAQRNEKVAAGRDRHALLELRVIEQRAHPTAAAAQVCVAEVAAEAERGR